MASVSLAKADTAEDAIDTTQIRFTLGPQAVTSVIERENTNRNSNQNIENFSEVQNSKANFKFGYVFDEISETRHGLIQSDIQFNQTPQWICVTENNTLWIA